MNKFSWNEKGFTMIEMLLVLSIVVVVSSSVLFVNSTRMKDLEEERFFQQLQLDIHRLQAVSIGEYKSTYLEFTNRRRSYEGKVGNVILFEKDMPNNIYLSDESRLKQLKFHPKGTIENFGNLLFITEKGEKRITLYIGRGVVNYEK
ncbi:prepilin-type N-terminal cleavage/methylation domain-containing protein [Psychrobacillus sp. OK028]|uniref:competence type IV pilus minor pilin ComGD n=1 Tax=Psychrobacillus sp. OK028 TaxID=1884359 RepID=UPI00088C158C|nr:competence type IV pilus minor pilin ComGD [Psychrobacillus sp. OK028]SDM86861.1 prepilin-type N-terminal cleavage/methylation domain-containing protein [Psychrobacillus sp. OK028]